MHLEGAKSVFDTIPEIVKSSPDFGFLKPWFQYHYIFSQYTYPPQPMECVVRLPDNTTAKGKVSLRLHCRPYMCDMPAQPGQIVGVLGCSSEVLELIGCINQLRSHVRLAESTSRVRSSNSSSPASHHEIVAQLEERLLNLRQELVLRPGATTGIIDNKRITLTAELYRIAATLYLYQVTHATFEPTVGRQYLLRQGLNILWEMKICSSPWPLFILACSVSNDSDRIRILDLMERSGSSRRIGNYSIIIALVKAVWKKQDLIVDEKAEREVDWRDLVEEGGYMPSFI
jgi:hypothetical protein